MAVKKLLAALSVFICFAAVAQTGTLSSGSININGTNRTFLVYKPTIYTGSVAVPLLLNFHGFGLTNTNQLTYGDFRKIADTANFIMVLPQASGSTPRWETFGSTPNAADMNFITALVSFMGASYNINQNRVYATGMSNGGFMSYDLAAFDTRFAAIASVAGDMTVTHLNTSVPKHPTPIMEIHGTSDLTVPWKGGTGNKYTPIGNLISYWVNFNKCGTTPVITVLPDINKTDNCTAEHHVYTSATGTVELYKIIGGGHTWPGTTGTKGGGSGNLNKDFSASLAIWMFLRRYSLPVIPVLAAKRIESGETITVNIYPNPASTNIIVNTSGNGIINSIQMTDVSGRRLQLFTGLNTSKYILHCSKNAPGQYIINVTLGDGSCITKKVLIL